MNTNQRLTEVKDYLIDSLNHTLKFLATYINTEEYNQCAENISDFINTVQDFSLDTNELKRRINRLRPILNIILYDRNCIEIHKEVFHALQIMTYVAPLNDHNDNLGNYKSIISLDDFSNDNVFYSSSGYLLHIKDMKDADMKALAPLSYKKQFSTVEVEALAGFMKMNEFNLRKNNAFLTVISSEATISILRSLLIAHFFLAILHDCVKCTANQARELDALSLSTGLSLLLGFVCSTYSSCLDFKNLTKTWAFSAGLTFFHGGMRSLAVKQNEHDIATLLAPKLNNHTDNILQNIIIDSEYVKAHTSSNVFDQLQKINYYFKEDESSDEFNAYDNFTNFINSYRH